MRALFLVLCLLAQAAWAQTPETPEALDAEWQACAALGLTPPCHTSGGQVGDITQSLADYLSVKMFGALGDGTDQTSKIQAAIDYAFAHGYQGIYCPKGTYVTSSTIYLDPPGNLRSNLANPTMFNFSLAFVGNDEGLGNDQSFGCTIKPTFNNAPAFLMGPGQGMAVRGIAIIGPSGTYRGNQSTSGVGIGTSGGNAGSSRNLIENTWVANFYFCYQTAANGNGNLGDSNSFRKVVGSNCAIGIDFASTQNDINDIQEAVIQFSTIGVRSQQGRQVTIVGGNISAINSVAGNFGISSISSLSKVADGNGFDYSFTGVIASPDVYWCNVYNAFFFVTSHFGVVPATCTNWNAGTSTATFQIYPPWAWGSFGTATDLTASTDIQTELQAVTTVNATERVTTLQGQGFSLADTHVENPGPCTTFLDVMALFTGQTATRIRAPYFNFDPAQSNQSGANIAKFYCTQTFPWVRVQPTGKGPLHWDGGNFGQFQGTEQSTLWELPPVNMQQFEARGLDFIAPINMRVIDNGSGGYAEPGGGIGVNNYNNVFNGAGEWDQDYFAPWTFASLKNIMWRGMMQAPYLGYHPAPWSSPNLSPYIKALDDALGALGTYPPISAQTVYKSVEWNSGALAHAHLRSASAPGYSYGQNLNDALLNSSHGTFTGVQSNGGGGAGTQLVVTGLSGSLGLNDQITGTGITPAEYVTACPGGGCNTNGTYTVSQSLNIASEAMTSFGTQVTWTYKGQSGMLYLDAKTLSWMFPGLAFQLSGGNNPSSHVYVVTGVYPTLGFITAVDSTSAQFGASPLQGTKTTVYSCSSQCGLIEAPYSWTAY